MSEPMTTQDVMEIAGKAGAINQQHVYSIVDSSVSKKLAPLIQRIASLETKIDELLERTKKTK